MKKYSSLIAFLFVSILAGCGEKSYMGDKITIPAAESLAIEEPFQVLFEQTSEIILSGQEQLSDEADAEENAGEYRNENTDKNADENADASGNKIDASTVSFSLKKTEIGEVLKECDKILKDNYQLSSECQVMEGYFYLEKDGNLLGRYAAKSEFIIFDKVNDKKYQIAIDGTEKTVEMKQLKESESADTMQAMLWNAVLEMVNALDFDKIAESEDDYMLLNLAGEVEVGSNGINPSSGKNKKFYAIENGTMVSADQQMIRGKQYALELTGATNEDGSALTAGSQIVVKHVAGVFMKCQ